MTQQEFLLQDWNLLLQKWVLGELDREEVLDLKMRLSYDSQFREDAGDWIRSLRELGWDPKEMRNT